ncbi:MAG: VWA domain-containing protein [Kiritimatiellia bacterium]|jgi:Ca-activated chloride channel family protein
MHVQFANPWALILLWLAPVIGIVWLAAWRLKARALERFLAPAMRAKLCPPPQPQRFYWQWALVLLGLLLALIAAARPQWGLREEIVRQRGRDLIVALDVSRSMLAQDVRPNRLQRSKADIQDLLRELRGDRVALIVFSGKALQLCPLTTDYAYLEQVLADVSPESAPRGETDIGDAIVKAMDAFENDAGAYQAVILVSDGEDLAGKAKAAAENARKKGVVIFTVGLGDPQGAKIPSATRPNEFMSYQGKDVVSKLQHETLKSIAEITGGAYVPVGTANVRLDTLYRDRLSKLTTRDIEESIQRRRIERYQWFLLPAVLALLAGALLSRGRLGKKAKAPQSVPATAVRVWPLLFPLALVAGLVQAQAPQQTTTESPSTNTPSIAGSSTNVSVADTSAGTGRDGARRAQRLYRMGAYHAAAKTYLAAMPGQTAALQNDCLYNAGNALYRAGQYQAAAAKYAELTTRRPVDPAAAFYNLGCAEFQLAEQAKSAGTNVPPGGDISPDTRPSLLERSGLAFLQALRHRNDDEAARANIGVVTNLLPEAREQAKLKTLLARYQGIPPPQLADTMLENQRKIGANLPAAMTNATPARIDQMEALSAQQRDNADLLIPLKISMASAPAQMAASSTSGVPQGPQVEQHIEAVRNTMQQATESLRNLENEAYRPVMTAESGVYNLWKGMAQFPQLLREDIFRQTNAINLTTSVLTHAAEAELRGIRHQQNEARELTGLFAERFSQAVPPGGTPVPASNAVTTAATATNAPEEKQAITAETRANILALAQQARTLQGQALAQIESTNLTAALPNQRQACELLKEIEKLLPKNKDQNRQQPNQQQDQNKQDQPKQDKQKQDQSKQDQPKQDQQKQEPPPQDKQQEQQPQPEAEKKLEQQDKDKEMTPTQAKALLEKAQQREKDHREERERDTYIPPSPVEKDW